MGYVANPLDGSLPAGIGKAVASGKRVGASGAHGIGEALSLFGAMTDALKDNLETDYQNGRKWLAFLKAGVELGVGINATIWVDLADYAEVSPEGRGDAGDQWVTIWVDIGAVLDLVPIPVAVGVVALDFEPNVPDPRRKGAHLAIGSFSTVTTEVSGIEGGLGDDGAEGHLYNVEVSGFDGADRFASPQVDAVDLQTSLYAFEIKKSLFDLLVVSAFSSIGIGVLSQEDFRGVATGLLDSFLARDSDGFFSALSDLKALTLGGVRRFTSSDTGEHRRIDGYFSGVYSSLGHVEDAPVENGDTLIVNFQNAGNTVANFRVERRVLTEGWRIDSLRPEDLFWGIRNFNWWSGEADMNNVEPDERGGTAWQIFADTYAPELGRIRFYLYHDRLGPLETLLDSMDVVVQRSPNLGDLARVTDLRMQRSSLRRNAYFLFSLSEASQVRFALSVLSADANLYLMRAGGREEVIASSRNGGTADEELVASLEPGIYYLRVHVLGYDVSRTLRYQLSYSNDTAGRYPLVIRDFGDVVDLAGAATQEGWVNSVDNRDDYYAFALSQPQGVRVALRGLSGDAHLYLEDALGQTLGSSTNGGTADEVIDQSLGAGIYYLRVEARGSGAIRYQVELSLQGVSGGGDGGVAGESRSFSLPGGGEMAFVWIEPGGFQMGSPESEEGRWDREGPVHEVEISRGFYLGKYEVTQGQWEAVMGTTPWSGEDYVLSNSSHPAVYISWEDVQEFVDKLNAASGSAVYRLPTEAEWEYACRAGTSTRWSFGDDESDLTDYAWYYDNAWAAGKEYAQPVGLKRANPWGLYDMHGNVWEWVNDWYSSGYYNSSPRVDPPGPSSGSARVFRGGAFYDDAQDLRSAQRYYYSPGYRSIDIGARLLRIR